MLGKCRCDTNGVIQCMSGGKEPLHELKDCKRLRTSGERSYVCRAERVCILVLLVTSWFSGDKETMDVCECL